METIARRKFLKDSVSLTTAAFVAPSYIKNMISESPNERVNIAVVGLGGERDRVRGIIRGRGIAHIREYAKMTNVKVKTVCDVDERLFPNISKEVEELFGTKPGTEIDFRNILADKDIDIVSLATPDHWHALQTVWAC